jgi:hypothetical protein
MAGVDADAAAGLRGAVAAPKGDARAGELGCCWTRDGVCNGDDGGVLAGVLNKRENSLDDASQRDGSVH